MIKKYKYLLVFFAITLSFILRANFASALEIKDYPNIPFAPVITEDSDLPAFVAYFFGLGIYLAGALAVISLVIGGIQLMFSSISPEARNNAIDRIKGSILGLVLLLASIIILNTINPTLVTPTLTPLVAGAGVFYTDGTDEKQAPDANPDTSSVVATGFKEIIYKCSASGGGTGPVLLVWKFPEKNYGRVNEEVTIERKNCGEKTSIEVPSFKTSFEKPGVYYFTKTGCAGFMSQTQLSDTQNIEEPFKSEMQSVQIINDIKNNINYGIILHKETNFRGDCSLPYQAYQIERECFDIPSDIPSAMSSANIFVPNNDKPETSGNGVVFFAQTFGFRTGANSGYFELSPQDIGTFWQDMPSSIDFTNSYNYVDAPPEEEAFCKTSENCLNSILIRGNYLTVLNARQLQSQPLYCQVFDGRANKGEVPNLKSGRGILVEGRKLDTIYVIPIK